MRTLGEFKVLKDDIYSNLKDNEEIKRVFEEAQKGPAIFRDDVELKIRAHWGQTLTVELTEVDLSPSCYLGYRLKEVVRKAVPFAEVVAAEVRRRRTLGTVTIVHLKVPDQAEAAPQKSAAGF